MLKNQVTNSEEAFTYEKINNIDKSLFSEVASSSSLRSPIERCFRNAYAFFEFRLEDKINNFWKHFNEDFMWDSFI